MLKRYVILLLILSGLCYAAYADVDGEDVARKKAVYSFTAFSETDTTTTIDMAGAGDSFAFMYTLSSYIDTVIVKYETSLDGTNWIAISSPDTITADGTYRELVTNASTMKYVRFIAECDTTFSLAPHWKPGD